MNDRIRVTFARHWQQVVLDIIVAADQSWLMKESLETSIDQKLLFFNKESRRNFATIIFPSKSHLHKSSSVITNNAPLKFIK